MKKIKNNESKINKFSKKDNKNNSQCCIYTAQDI